MSQEMLEVNHKFTLMNAAREKVALLMFIVVWYLNGKML